MKKDRFVAFFDAVMAIIMTIVVLEFVIPGGAEWKDLNVFWFQLMAYALAFFWLGTMWINLHSVWHHVETVSREILFVNLFTLFFSSLVPFLTVYQTKIIRTSRKKRLYAAFRLIFLAVHLVQLRHLHQKYAIKSSFCGAAQL